MAKKLVDRLKIVLGRQLSPKQIANAKEESKGFEPWLRSDLSKKIDDLEKRNSGEFVRFKQRFDYMESDYIPNTKDYYLSRAVVEVYDSKGRIKEKTVSKNVWGGHGDNITRIFNPPGRLIGEKSESSR